MTHLAFSAVTVLAENSLFKLVGEIFHPLFVLVGTVLAFIYGLIPNYAVAIILLTILIMALLTPLTVKSTKSMVAMQALQPELQKLRQKYKGAENREQLNQEMMRLYKEHGVSPTGGCLPMFLQMPALIVLYDTIRGLTNTVKKSTAFPTTAVLPIKDAVAATGRTAAQLSGRGAGNGLVYVGAHHTATAHLAALKCQEAVCAVPRYIPSDSKMFQHLVATPGVMKSFGLNLASKPLTHRAEWYDYIPYFVLVAIAVGLQYFQMSQMTKRNRNNAAQIPSQMQTMQKVMPLIFAYIYFLVPAGVVIYMIVSSAIRIGTQDVIFRYGLVQRPGERQIGGGAKRSGAVLKKPGTGPPSGPAAIGPGDGGEKKGPGGPAKKPAPKAGGGTTGSGGRAAANGKPAGVVNGARGNTDGTTTAKPHPRSKSKRTRKAR
ncbi:MAG TPA: YidC/Oxa1 family membrane protein insertase [Acidimicrobiales bacterium]|nr:YidC/Oxa1 family membrane protein insertase [Acidimicrobiales bacterium]